MRQLCRICAATAIAFIAITASHSTRAEPTATTPAAPQPTLPPGGGPKPSSPVVDDLMSTNRPPLDVRKHASSSLVPRHRRFAHARHRSPIDVERPALAGVELVAPLPSPPEAPHIDVPMPAYPLDSLAASLTSPPPPVMCHRTRRDLTAPDPHLAFEASVACAPDNP